MIERHIIFILIILLFPSFCRADSFTDKFSLESAHGVLSIGDSIRSGVIVGQDSWDWLFQTDGYHKYLATGKGNVLRSMIKDAIVLAFSPDKSVEADDFLHQTPEANDYKAVMNKNICTLSRRRDEALRFMAETDFTALLSKANQLVRNYLPQKAVTEKVSLNNLYLICTIPDASVRGHSVLLDLNMAMDMTQEEIVRLLAHEFFHNYREATLAHEPKDSFWKIFNCSEDEGIADLIDKGDHPETMYTRYGESFKTLYLNEYRNSFCTLQKLDSLLTIFMSEPVEGEYAPVADLLVFNGHPTGFYMTRLIREEGLEKKLIQVFDSPAAFVELYNKAALRKNSRGGTEYIFSKDMLIHLNKAEKSIAH